MASSALLIKHGKEAFDNVVKPAFFAKFGEKAGVDERKASAYYLMALGYQASGDNDKAQENFARTLELRNSILWANVYSKQ